MRGGACAARPGGEGFVRLDTEGSEARSGKDAEAGEELPESGRRHGQSSRRLQGVAHNTIGGSLLLCIHHYPRCNVDHGSKSTATGYEAVNQCAK
jgi:hypothetical protein